MPSFIGTITGQKNGMPKHQVITTKEIVSGGNTNIPNN